jgi:uncharacterized coiled-coil protein SlyX
MSDSNRPFGQVCQHGSLKRKCTICDQDAEITELKAQLAERDAELFAKDREIERLREALKNIINPMKKFQDEVAASNGELRLDPVMAIALCENVGYLQTIAEAALAASEPTQGAK